LRLCSVVSGKFRVRVDGEPPFLMGSRGKFKINPDVAFVVENPLYVEPLLDVTSIVSHRAT